MKATEHINNVSSSIYRASGTPMSSATPLSEVLAEVMTQAGCTAVVVIKASGLVQINSSRGFDAGDVTIREMVRRIRELVESAQFVGHLGGGRFLATITGEENDLAVTETIRRLIASLSEPIELPSGPVYVSCSVGASLVQEGMGTAEELIGNAELALAKAAQGSHVLYSPSLRVEVSETMEIRSALKDALERDEFYLAYQPQICQENGQIFGVEALLRWQSETLGAVAPNRFIPVAEAFGMMPRIGDWVVHEACRQARSWLDAGTPLRVAVNVCAAQLEAPGFVETVSRTLSRNGLPAHLLELEVTESMLMPQENDDGDTLKAIRELGVKLGLDDFGTGYSNLAYLRNFTFDTLKIDRLFISALTGENADDVLVRSIIAIGKDLGHEVIAEGIETEAQKNALIKLGCTRMQGFLFGRPMPAEQLGLQASAGRNETEEGNGRTRQI